MMSGNVGIGTTNPNVILEVVGANPGIQANIRTQGDIHVGNGALSGGGLYFGSGGYSWATGDYIGQSAAGKIQIIAGGSNYGPQLVINNGKVGIGTSVPDKQLEVSHTEDAWLRIGADNDNIGGDNGTQNAYLQFTTDGNNDEFDGLIWLENLSGDTKLHFDVENQETMVMHNGNVGIGMSAPSQRLTVYNGTTTGTYTTDGWQHSSDERLKTNINQIDNALEKVTQMEGVYFDWKDKSDDRQVGLIAQDLEKTLPEVVNQDTDGYYSISYGGVVPVLIEAIKEQQTLILQQQKQIDELKQDYIHLLNKIQHTNNPVSK